LPLDERARGVRRYAPSKPGNCASGSRASAFLGGFAHRPAARTSPYQRDEKGLEMTAIEEKLVEYIDDAYAMEQNVLRMLDGMIGTTKDPQMKRALERHRKETEKQAERLEECLAEHDATPSRTKEAGGVMAALMKSVVDMARGDKAGRNARDGFATEHMEIASYQMLERVAKKAGDKHTAAVARQNREEEEAMARSIDAKWNKIVDQSLREEGVRTS
jgi:ferritin-like metal-binding protein YciE